ncbi:GNAT family protein [Stigmatella sp. ncwal1]|uniref:GNAT family protein n=1 Tax=Stigmatella ashevillensis TaxID=2995309 RepID=A0ABT5D8J0_9BACT|nr:GNAT family protein [Stigmatella ashevillena]MDC0709990.1 GNAT family protein [Stigmatella ashevillena]
MKNPFVTGPRLYLRPIEREDAPQLAVFVNDPNVRRTLLLHRPLNVAQEYAFVESLERDEHQVVLGIARRESPELIGVINLFDLDFRSRRAEFGLFIGDRSLWGQGYGTEATRMMLDYGFGTLNLSRVWLQVFAHHAAGIRAYEKAGFRREGVLREQHYAEGKFVDAVVMGILRAEWMPLSLPQ